MVPDDCESSASYQEWQDQRLIALYIIAITMLVIIGSGAYMVYLFL